MSTPSLEELESLHTRHGAGFYLLDPSQFRANIRRFRAAFGKWHDVELGWSFKTNWLPTIVRAAVDEGARPEVVSRAELDLALALGFAPETVLFNGPVKTPADLAFALEQGIRVHLDGPEEVEDVLALRASTGRDYAVGIRLNIELGVPSRFGFTLDDADQVARRLRAAGVRLDGLHLHISGARKAEDFARRARALVEAADRLWPAGDGPRFIDIGGGFAGAMPAELATQLSFTIPSYEDYGDAILAVLTERWPAGGPTLVLEPGMALVADTMRFAARVEATKHLRGTDHAIVAASAYTVKPTLHRLDMPAELVPRGPRGPGPTAVSGYTCMEIDILHRTFPSELRRGDWLVFENCGAYTFVLNPRFIRPTPAVLVPTASGWRAVRAADNITNWLRPCVPAEAEQP